MIDADTLSRPAALDGLADELHRRWVRRRPVLIEWDVAEDALSGSESTTEPPWSLEPRFLFPKERLRFLCFTNNYDARRGTPKWWWTVKAAATGVKPGTVSDATLPDGTDVWIDGGPRHPLPPLGVPVVHGESIESRSLAAVPVPVDITADLAADQREAVAHLSGAARIIAPAGSGKTRTLTTRLAHLMSHHGVEPPLITALAYNERAASEMRHRSGVGRSTARTIHSLGWEILRQTRPDLTLIEERGSREIIERLVSLPRRANTDQIGPYLEAFQTVRAGLRDPADVEAERDDIPGFANIFETYRKRLYRGGAVDHGEQVYGAIEILLGDDAVRRHWQDRCRHLLVDEFQDLTPAYVLLIRLVASPQLDVFGVGDDDQVIYGFDGADPGFLIDFAEYFGGAGEHALETNYRCAPAIVSAATHLLSYNHRRIDKTIVAARGAGADPGDGLRIMRAPGDRLAIDAAAQISAWCDSGVAPADIAVLSRVNSSLIAVKAALVDIAVPTADLVSPQALERTTLRALFAWMRIAMRPEDMSRSDLVEAVVRPGRKINRIARQTLTRRSYDLEDLWQLADRFDAKQAERWKEFLQDVRTAAEVAASGDAGDLIGMLVDDVGLGTSARDLDSGRSNASRSGHLDDLVALRRTAAVHPRLDDFAGWLRTTLSAPSDDDGVTLSSVHRVKGMEWQRVIVFGADRGTMPHELATDLEEERRVFHVAITRAIDEAVVMADERRPSRFLAELDGSAPRAPVRTPQPQPGRVAKLSKKVAVATGDVVKIWGGTGGTVVGFVGNDVKLELETGAVMTVARGEIVEVVAPEAPPLGELDAALADALKTWRSETSRERGVPAYVVLHDATIEEIARRRPSTERELLAISGIGASKLENYGDDILAVVESAG